jgi:hypothetical protein
MESGGLNVTNLQQTGDRQLDLEVQVVQIDIPDARLPLGYAAKRPVLHLS